MKSHFQKLLDYNSWTNRRLLACLQDNTVMNNKIFLLFSHILTAEQVWLCRAKNLPAPTQRLWQVYANDALQRILEENSRDWLEYLENSSKSDLTQTVVYQNTKGETFSTQLDDIITHLVNHNTHHRAQIVSMLQQEKILAPASDYIIYIREGHTSIAAG